MRLDLFFLTMRDVEYVFMCLLPSARLLWGKKRLFISSAHF